MPIVASESCLRLIPFTYPDLMVTRPQIKLRKILRPLQLIHQLINLGYGIPVLDNLLVEGSVVYAHPEGPILLHQYYRRGKRTRAGSNVAHCQQLLDGLLYLIFIGFGIPIRSGDHCLSSLF